jgi:peroxiredoxin
MRSDIVPGGIFPDYELPDHTGKLRKLSELQGDDPLILTLARGHYCPKEHQQHLELAAFYPKIAVAYTQVVTIATDDHHTLQEFRASVGAQWTFLSDPGRTIQKDLDIQEYTDPEHNPMIPHTLVLKPGLVIYSIYNGYWFWGRPSIADLWRDLRAATSEIRPDWDLSTPGLREAWNAGDFSRFHGWNKQASKTREDVKLCQGLNQSMTDDEQNPANGFAASPEESDIQSGTPLPIGGPHQQGDGVCFVLFSRHATRVRLEFYQHPDDSSPTRIIDLDPMRHRTGDIWHVWVRGIAVGQLYGYRIEGPYQPEEGHRFNPHKLLLDPYARAIAGVENWDFSAARGYDSSSRLTDLSISTVDNAGTTPKCIVTRDNFDWEMDSPPKHSASDTVIYETHVRGFTIHPVRRRSASWNLRRVDRKDPLSPGPGSDRH